MDSEHSQIYSFLLISSLSDRSYSEYITQGGRLRKQQIKDLAAPCQVYLHHCGARCKTKNSGE